MSDTREPSRSDFVPLSLELFTVAETAAILGVSRRLVTNWIHNSSFRCSSASAWNAAAELGTRIRIPRVFTVAGHLVGTRRGRSRV
jgi:hypothetical protein